jgi:tyrosyl-tRNA synthetase
MSKSLNNAIGIHEPASEMYGKLMSISDELMWRYWTLLTDLRGTEIEVMKSDVGSGALHPMQAKKNLAHAITKDFHSEAEADAAAEGWAKQFQQKAVSEDVPIVKIAKDTEGLVAAAENVDGHVLRMPKLLHLVGLAASTGEATRKLSENAVSINGQKFTERVVDFDKLGLSPILRLGKKSVKVEWS